MGSTMNVPIVFCCLVILGSYMMPANASEKNKQVLKNDAKQVSNATASVSTPASGHVTPRFAQASQNEKQQLKKDPKKIAASAKIKVPIVLERHRRDLMTAAGHKKYLLVKKKPKNKKIKMEVYKPKMKYKKIMMKVPVKTLKKKKVKGYMVKKKHHY